MASASRAAAKALLVVAVAVLAMGLLPCSIPRSLDARLQSCQRFQEEFDRRASALPLLHCSASTDSTVHKKHFLGVGERHIPGRPVQWLNAEFLFL
jgi:hypothetical protein